ncbi:Reticulon-domain-containing protein, partial [Truncatella angustata]
SNADYGIQGKAGPLKQAIGKTDSLYKYINWEEPSRTISSYIGALAFLSGLHYFPLTQLALKASAIVFGIMSVASFVTRSFNTKTAGRLAPREYKRIPEDTLNATLKDVHDFVQYAVVQVQRIVLGEDLNKTFAAFVGSTALYWLIKVVSPFGLSVIGLTSVYLATLLTSPRGREAALDASARAGEIANTAAQSGKQIAQDGANQAAAFSSKARDTVTDVGRRSLDTAGSNIQSAKKQAKRAAGNAQGTAQSAT